MATADLPRTKKTRSPKKVKPPRAKKSRAFRYGCLLTLLLLAAGVFFAPAIVARTSLGTQLVARALEIDGTVSIGSTSLGWFSSVEVENLEILDAEGDVVLAIPSLRTEKQLISLALNTSDLGRVYVDHPALKVVAFERGTNLEMTFASLLKSPNVASTTVQLEITDGSLTIDDKMTGSVQRVDNVDGSLFQDDDNAVLTLSGDVPDERQAGNFKIHVSTRGSAKTQTALANGKVDCQSTAIPLELCGPFLRRYANGAQLSGRLSTQLGGAWGDMAEGGETSISGQSEISDLVLTSAALGSDRIELAKVEMPCRLVQEGDIVRVEQLGVDCELAKLSLAGTVKMADFSAADLVATLLRENYELKGNVDVARLAALLPASLRLNEGTSITSGQLQLDVTTRRDAESTHWQGKLDASELAAVANGKNLHWDKPLAIDFEAHENKDGLALDQLKCQSDFLQVEAAGSLDELTASADFDLARLMSQLRQVANLDHVQLAGAGQADLKWKRAAADQFTAVGKFQANGFQLIYEGGRAWKEDSVVATLDLKGLLQEHQLKRIDRAALDITAGNEEAHIELTEALADPGTAAWPVRCSWQGQLSHWATRLESCLGIGGWDLAGAGNLEATARCSRSAIENLDLKLDVAKLLVQGHGCFINEPVMNATLAGRLDLAKPRVEISQSRLALGTTVAVLSTAALQSTAEGWALEGASAQLGADLATLYRWQHDPRVRPEYQVSGRLVGEAQFKYASGTSSGRIEGRVEQLQLVDLSSRPAGSPAPAWRKAQLTLTADASLLDSGSRLEFQKLQLKGAAIGCDARGKVPLSAAGGEVDLRGQVSYDWEQLTPLLRPYVGVGLQVAGRQAKDFRVAGQLNGSPLNADAWRQVTGEVAVGWSGMNVSGLIVGPGEVVGQISDGQLHAQPIDVQVSEGRFTMNPLVRFSPSPAELLLSRGPLLSDVHLTPELCSRGLKYITPVLAQSTVADGRFSIVMDGGRVPLADPTTGDVAGQMAIRGQAKPGPIAQEFVVILTELTTLLKRGTLSNFGDQSGAVLSIDDSNIEFRMVGSRVYHRGLTFVVGTTPITTHGSVGFDETLAIVAEVPVQAKLLGVDLSLGTLEGQTLQIPLEGTLSKPKFDRHILQQFAGKFLQNAARGAIVDEVKSQLDRLLPKP